MVLGIIIFIVYNSVDNFSVGIPYCIRSISDPGSPVPMSGTQESFSSRAEAEEEAKQDHDLEVIECDVDGNPITTRACSARRHRYNEYRQQLTNMYFITGDEITQQLTGYITIDPSAPSSPIYLTDDEYTLVWDLLEKCTDEEGEQVESILRSDKKDNFLRDLSKSSNLEYLYDTRRESILRYQGLINYYSNSGITLDYLIDFGIRSTTIGTSGDFTLFRLTTYDSALFDVNIGNIRNFNVRSGNSRPQFGLPDDDDYTTYALGETTDNLIRARINYDPAENYLAEFTAFPVGHGYGAIFLKMLYKSSEHVLIRSFLVDTPENKWAYRSLFRLSVTPIRIDARGFVEGYEYDYTIFRPNRDLMILIYPRYNDLYRYINPMNRSNLNLFLMSLNLDILRDNLIDHYNPEKLLELFDTFWRDHG